MDHLPELPFIYDQYTSTANEDLLNIFNGYEYAEDCRLRGKDVVEREVDDIYKKVTNIDLNDVVACALKVSNEIAPKKKLQVPEIYFVYAGRNINAKVVDEKVVVNFGNFASGNSDTQEIEGVAKSLVAHELVHIFLKQIGPPRSTGNILLETLWEEGLATYIETKHMRAHEDFVHEADMWWGALTSWLSAESIEQKKEIVEGCLSKSQALKKYFPHVVEEVLTLIDSREVDNAFGTLMVKANGPIYHLGFLMWQDMIGEIPLEDLVNKGSSWVIDYLNLQ